MLKAALNFISLESWPDMEKGRLGKLLHRVGWFGDLSALSSDDVASDLLNAVDSRGFNALHLAVWNMHYVCVEKILHLCPDLVDIPNQEGRVPIHFAAWNNDTDALQALGMAGADLLAKDENGWNALHWAASGGALDIIKTLAVTDRFVDKEGMAAITTNGETALHIAAERGRYNVFTWLSGFVAKGKEDFLGETADDLVGAAPERWRKRAWEVLRRE